MAEPSQRDVVFTPFMLRVRDAIHGSDGNRRLPDLRLAPSSPKGVAEANDEWVGLRARSEQVVAEANAMLGGLAQPVQLDDEAGTGELAFVLRCGDSAARISMALAGRQASVSVAGSGVPALSSAPTSAAPVDAAMLEDLVVLLLGLGARRTDG
jgi:hypothetical protein